MQRFGLARALYSRPQLLVLDEATSSLDADTEASISRSLRKLGAKTTKIVVAHRLSTVQSADVVFVMEGGRVVDQGTLDELLKRNSLVRRYAKLMKVGS
jgi:ABC-type multidrug transport system fused ATPase/permease subunit